jgi:hypothetical protein
MGTKTIPELEAQRYRKTVTLLPLVVTGKPRASIADLSPAKQIAVIECFNNNGVHKRDGWWHGRLEGNRISGTTVADLVRDRLLRRFGAIERARHLVCLRTSRGRKSRINVGANAASCHGHQKLYSVGTLDLGSLRVHAGHGFWTDRSREIGRRVGRGFWECAGDA